MRLDTQLVIRVRLEQDLAILDGLVKVLQFQMSVAKVEIDILFQCRVPLVDLLLDALAVAVKRLISHREV